MAGKPDRHLSVRDAAITLGVPDTTVRLWLDRGDLAGGGSPQWVSDRSVRARLASREQRRSVRLAVTVGALKGGVGKSTTVWVLACLLAAEGGRVLVVDADTNSQSLTQWANRYIAAGGQLPFEVLPWATHDLIVGVRRRLEGVDHLLIDTGPDGGDLTLLQAALAVAPILLVPLAPRDIELSRLWATLEAARRGAALTGQPAYPLVLLNRISLSRLAERDQARTNLAAAPALRDVPVADPEVRDLAVFTRMTVPLTVAGCGDYVGVLDELRAFASRIEETSWPSRLSE